METNETASSGTTDLASVRELLIGSGYADRAIDYYIAKASMGSLPDADQVSELTGTCGDTMKVFLKVVSGRIEDVRYQVLGCPGAIAAAMAAAEMVKGKTLSEAMVLKDGDVFRRLEGIPEQKQHCIRLAVKALQKAAADYRLQTGKETKNAAV